ncbi:MAG: KH domain-containing protein [Actinomycetota bacterium]|jgi:spoIIIJ-associated protein|nr:KH domain-containing protein [Actinomycetota bacterium]
MSENASIEEAISKFVESLEEEQKNDKLLESNNIKESYIDEDTEEYYEEEIFEEGEHIVEEDWQKAEKIKGFIEKVIALVTNSEVSEITYDDMSGKINIYGKDLGIAIGKNGKNMEAIEYILNLYVKRKNLSDKSITIDIKDYKKKKFEIIKNLALKMAGKAIKEQKKIILKPMPSYERKIIHDVLSDNKEVKTKSKNKEPYRRIIIYPLKEN